MRSISPIILILYLGLCALLSTASPIHQNVFATENPMRNVSAQLFNELEEFSRIVDIAYCVGVTGIRHPFECAGRCGEFPEWELVDTWNTGPLMSDSCGYIALDHVKQRIVVAFRGTYSIANTIVDLSTTPQEYVPYPGNPDDPEGDESQDDDPNRSWWDHVRHPFEGRKPKNNTTVFNAAASSNKTSHRCLNCTVHSGFFTSWQHTRPIVLPHVSQQRTQYPNYKLHLVGHSLGGAVAALAGVEFELSGWDPTITTFGEPRIGNKGLRVWLDALFELKGLSENGARYRRVTHVDDPVPLLPLAEWGFRMHGGEVFISKSTLSPSLQDLQICDGDEDSTCIAGDEELSEETEDFSMTELLSAADLIEAKKWGLPARYKLWQLFFAHRDYFWRLGLCVPGGDPYDWGRGKYGANTGNGDEEGKAFVEL